MALTARCHQRVSQLDHAGLFVGVFQKSILNRVCQLLAIRANKMAPRTSMGCPHIGSFVGYKSNNSTFEIRTFLAGMIGGNTWCETRMKSRGAQVRKTRAPASRCRANMAHIRQPRPYSGLGSQIRPPKTF